MKDIRKRLIAFVLAVIFVLSVITGNTGISFVDQAAVKEVRASSGNVSMRRILTECEVPVVERKASEGLLFWRKRTERRYESVFALPGICLGLRQRCKQKDRNDTGREERVCFRCGGGSGI